MTAANPTAKPTDSVARYYPTSAPVKRRNRRRVIQKVL